MSVSIVYYTNNMLPAAVWRTCWDQIHAVKGSAELVSVSQLPLPTPINVVVGNKPPCLLSMYEAILAGLERCTGDLVYLAEHDVLYPPGYFAERALPANRLTYQENIVRLDAGGWIAYSGGAPGGGTMQSQCCGHRHDLIVCARRRIDECRAGVAHKWAEFAEYPCDRHYFQAPAVDVRHGGNLTGGRASKVHIGQVPYWGSAKSWIDRLQLDRVPTADSVLRRRIVVYSCLFGDCSDGLQQPVEQDGVDWVLYSDQPRDVPSAWRVEVVQAQDSNARRASRHPKMLPHLYMDADTSVYVDARVHLTARPSDVIAQMPPTVDLCVFRHRRRRCSYDEAAEVIDQGMVRGQDLYKTLAQVRQYAAAGFPPQCGLPECGLIVRRHTPDVAAFGTEWWSAFFAGGPRDQLSMTFAAWRSRLRWYWLPGSLDGNSWCKIINRKVA